MNSRWPLFLQNFTFIFQQKKYKKNVIDDTLSRRVQLPTIVKTKITSFDTF